MNNEVNKLLTKCIENMFDRKLYFNAFVNFILTNIIIAIVFTTISLFSLDNITLNIDYFYISDFFAPIFVSAITLMYLMIVGTFNVLYHIRNKESEYKERLIYSFKMANKSLDVIFANISIFVLFGVVVWFFLISIFNINEYLVYIIMATSTLFYLLTSTFIIIAVIDKNNKKTSVLEYALKSIYKHKLESLKMSILICLLIIYYIFVIMQNIIPIIGQIIFIFLYPTTILFYVSIISQIEKRI